MNFKFVPILAFVGWSAMCWRWYVCEIKQVCNGEKNTVPAIAAPIIEPSTEVDPVTGLQMETEKNSSQSIVQETTVSKDAPASAPSSESSSEVDINKFSVVENGDLITIHFPYNSVENEENAEAEIFIANLAAQLKESNRKLLISGHTDSVGDGVSNEKVALQRSKKIREKLIAQGVSGAQITCQTFGERKPVATNDNPQGRYKNRRVEFRLQ